MGHGFVSSLEIGERTGRAKDVKDIKSQQLNCKETLPTKWRLQFLVDFFIFVIFFLACSSVMSLGISARFFFGHYTCHNDKDRDCRERMRERWGPSHIVSPCHWTLPFLPINCGGILERVRWTACRMCDFLLSQYLHNFSMILALFGGVWFLWPVITCTVNAVEKPCAEGRVLRLAIIYAIFGLFWLWNWSWQPNPFSMAAAMGWWTTES